MTFWKSPNHYIVWTRFSIEKVKIPFAFKLCLFEFDFSLLMCQTLLQIEHLLLLKTTFSVQIIRLTNEKTNARCNLSTQLHDHPITSGVAM